MPGQKKNEPGKRPKKKSGPAAKERIFDRELANPVRFAKKKMPKGGKAGDGGGMSRRRVKSRRSGNN